MSGARAQTLHAAAHEQAGIRPGQPAIIYEDQQTTYGELDRESNRAAQALRAAGLAPGSRVGYLGKDCPAYFEIALACAKSGCVLVPINWRLSAREVDHILRDSGASLLFAEPEFLPVAQQVMPPQAGHGDIVTVGPPRAPGDYPAWKAAHPATCPAAATGPDDPVIQVYTSGTTGLPKGVVLAHRSFFAFNKAMAGAGADWFDWLPSDVSLVAFPGSYVAGLSWFMHSFIAGVPSVIMRIFVPEEAVRLIERHGVTITYVAPAMLQMLLLTRGVGPAAFRSLRKVAYGAAPIPDALLTRCLDVMGCQFVQVYASTETGSVATILPPADHVPGSPLLRSVGRACPGNEVRVEDENGRPLPPGEIGQVCIKTPAHMLEYWGMPEATGRTLSGGWLRMGDAGYLDGNGYLFLCDRIGDTIIVAGQNIYPAEVENVLAGHPAVAETAVIGVPDERWGEAVRACVVLAGGATAGPRDLMLYLRGKIADFKIPTQYVFMDSLPRNPSGKVLRRALRDRAGEARAPAGAHPQRQSR